MYICIYVYASYSLLPVVTTRVKRGHVLSVVSLIIKLYVYSKH